MSDAKPILLIEDDDDHAVLFDVLLAQSGVKRRLVRAASLAEGRELLAADPPWVAVVDLGLPDSVGLESLTLLEQDSPETPVIVLTANAESRVSVDAIREGAQDFLVKGEFTPELLARSLHYAAERIRIRLELEQRTRDVETFAAIASHDLQGPLRRIVQAAGIARDALSGEALQAVEPWLNTIQSQSGRLQTLVGDLLRFSRSGREGLQIQECALADCVDDALSLLAAPVAESGARVRTESLPRLAADKGLITTLLQNLLGNAIKYVRGRRPEIRVTGALNPEAALVQVTDNGFGVDEADIERIFEPCQRAVGREEFEGSGLGLATCRRIVEAHGGRIWAESVPGKGSTFSFLLPNRTARVQRPEDSVEAVAR